MYDYDPDQKPKTSKEERDKMMKKFLEKGGKVKKLEPGYPINVGSLDKSKKPQWTREDIAKGISGKSPMPDLNTYKPNTYHDFDLGGDKIPVFIPTKKNDKD